MNQLDRYLIITVVQSTIFILAILSALGGFVAFAAQVDNVGTGSYALNDALAYVALTLPQQAYDMLPVAALLGALLGLGALASHGELIVMRAAGISMWRFGLAILVAGAFLGILTLIIGEFIAPPAEQYAKKQRAQKLHSQLNFTGGQSGWIRDGNVIINIGELLEGGRAGTVGIFELDNNGRLLGVAAANSASVTDDAVWYLENYRETRFTESGIRARKQHLESRQSRLNPELLKLSVVDPAQFSARRLRQYVEHLRSNNLNSDRYEIAFWTRITNVVSVTLMCLLALPFVFGSLRSVGAGTRVMVGILFGIAYYLMTKTLANSGTVYGLDPAITAWLPTLGLALVVAVLISRVH
ncbi:MAG: LPS export ABC transporter permease LptG [Gammaproteobacteria bacterium]|nr:LPS export ABC transporter permease LptG [Gammaproteobacteria bacterium]